MPRSTSPSNVNQLRMDVGTGGTEISFELEPGPAPTQTTQITESSGVRRTLARLHHADATEIHQNDYMIEWRLETSKHAGAGGQRLLLALGELGFAWRDIAKMIGVSVPAIQKWRKGEGISGQNVRKLASLLAACNIIARTSPDIRDIASWFEVPLLEEAPVTPIDLWASGNQQLVFEHARMDVDPIVTLDSFDPNWRENYQSEFESVRDDQGKLGLRMKDR